MKELLVKSAVELTPPQKKKLEDALGGKGITLKYQVDAIVGGLMIYDGEKVIDASYSHELESVKKASARLIDKNLREGVSLKDIPNLIKEKMEELVNAAPDVKNCGRVIFAADGVIQIEGLSGCRYGELLLIGKSGFALAMNLETDRVGAILLSEADTAEYGDSAFSSGKIIEVPVGEELSGRVVNPLGVPLDGQRALRAEHTRRIESPAPRIVDRAKVNEPLETGILAIDSMIPIGKGQRELIIGDRQTGKTALALDTILNQRGKNVHCVYVAIGQRASAIGKIVKTLKDYGAMSYTTVVAATASDSAPLQYIAPYAGAAIAEWFMERGEDALVVYDDLSKHAVAYRAISLLLKRPSGREAFPGDIFYIHSKLLERAAKLNKEHGGGSVTALPIIETQAGDISAYIPTNVISITDGQIYLEEELFHAGQRPAVNVGLSVSRVGGAAQHKMIRKLSSQLRLDIAHFRELQVFAQFGSSLDDATKEILEQGAKTVEALKQPEYAPLSMTRESLYLYAITKGYLKSVEKKDVGSFLDGHFGYVYATFPDLCKKIKSGDVLNEEEEETLRRATEQYIEYVKKHAEHH